MKHHRLTFAIRVVVKAAIFGYLIICAAACTLQRKIMYHPFTEIAAPQTYGLTDFKELRLQDTDGTHIAAWYHAAHSGYPTLLFFHGNAGNIGNRSQYFQTLAQVGFGLLAIDYRGYGGSEGSPSEEGFYQDARAAMEYATQTLHLPLNRIIPYGESIGTGVAVKMATEFPVGAVVLQSPYTSIENIARLRFPWLPVHWLILDKYDSLGRITNVHAPLLLFHGEVDAVIPVEEGRTLFAHANEPKQAVYFLGQGHNDLDTGQRIEALLAFCHAHGLITGERH